MASSRRATIARWLGATLASGALAACASPQHPKLARFAAVLGAQDSATSALEQWCAAEGIAHPAAINATVLDSPARPEPDDARRLLGVAKDSPLAYRHVRLACGDVVLSEAHNWYIPALLTPAMNQTLATSRVPFGKVVAPLGFRRERLASPAGRGHDCPDHTILAHRAMLRLPDGRPLALLVECYTRANLTP